jgi:hypothetical protein
MKTDFTFLVNKGYCSLTDDIRLVVLRPVRLGDSRAERVENGGDGDKERMLIIVVVRQAENSGNETSRK